MTKDLLNLSFDKSGTQKISKRVPIAQKPKRAIPNVSSDRLDKKRLAKPVLMAESTQEALSTPYQMRKSVHRDPVSTKKIFQLDKKPPQAIPRLSSRSLDNKKVSKPIPKVRKINLERLYDLNERGR